MKPNKTKRAASKILSVRLPKRLADEMARVIRGQFQTDSEYIRELIRRDLAAKNSAA